MKLFFLILFLPITALAEPNLLHESIEAQVFAEVQKECESCTFKVHFSSDLRLDKEDVIKSVSSTHWKGKTVVMVDVVGISVLKIPVNIRWFDAVVVAKNNIRHGKVIRASDLKVITKDMTFNTKAYLNEANQVVGKVGKRAFRKGQLIDASNVKEPNIVKYGQPMSVTLIDGPLNMTVSGKAKGSGAAGDMIPIIINKTKKKVMAKIIDKSTARIE